MSTDRDQAIDQSIAKEQERREFLKATKAAAELAEARARISQLESDLDIAEQRLDIALKLEQSQRSRKPARPPKLQAGDHHGAFVLMCSDWHVGEVVDPATVSGRNAFDQNIARKRVASLSEGARWMIEAWRSGSDGYGWKMNQVVCWLGGDIITGAIHDDLRETNDLSPTEQTELAQDLCIDLLDSLAAHPGIDEVIVPTSRGNHGRDTPDRRVSSGHLRSYEQLMYRQIKRFYERTNDKVHVIVSDDEITRLKVLNTATRWSHGDQFNYNGGVGGITIPMMKWLAKLDETEPADVTGVGHHHNYIDTGRGIVNNCLIGFGPYGQRFGGFRPASQVCFLIDEKHGKRMSTEIIVQ